MGLIAKTRDTFRGRKVCHAFTQRCDFTPHTEQDQTGEGAALKTSLDDQQGLGRSSEFDHCQCQLANQMAQTKL